jgi:hypothetical protein
LPPYGVPSTRLNLGKESATGRGDDIAALIQLNTAQMGGEKM